MKKKEKSRQMFIGTIGVVMTAIALAGAIKEEVTFVCSVCSELNVEGENKIIRDYTEK